MALFLITLLLLTVNILFVNYSDSKRRYGIYSSRIFQLFAVLYLLSYLTSLGSEQGDGASLSLYDMTANTSKPSKISNKKASETKIQTLLSANKSEDETEKTSLTTYMLESASLQAIITILFAFIGLKLIKKEKDYYQKMMLIHIPILLVCLFVYFYN